jgi:hypothetical protein
MESSFLAHYCFMLLQIRLEKKVMVMLPKTIKRLIDSHRLKTFLMAAGVKYKTV